MSFKPTYLFKPLSKKTPLTYPGAKSLTKNKIVEKLTDLGARQNGICSPFMGGGSVEIYAAYLGLDVLASDLFEPLIEFWTVLKSEPEQLAYRVFSILAECDYNMEKGVFRQSDECYTAIRDMSRRVVESDTPLERAACFYIRNKTAYAGTMFKYSNIDDKKHDRTVSMLEYKREFSEDMIDRLADFNTTVEIKLSDYRDAIASACKKVLFCDPPYVNASQKLYGFGGSMQTGFDHHEFYERVTAHKGEFIVAYDNDPFVHKLWAGYTIEECNWTYGMTAGRQSKRARDVLIYSTDFKC